MFWPTVMPLLHGSYRGHLPEWRRQYRCGQAPYSPLLRAAYQMSATFRGIRQADQIYAVPLLMLFNAPSATFFRIRLISASLSWQ